MFKMSSTGLYTLLQPRSQHSLDDSSLWQNGTYQPVCSWSTDRGIMRLYARIVLSIIRQVAHNLASSAQLVFFTSNIFKCKKIGEISRVLGLSVAYCRWLRVYPYPQVNPTQPVTRGLGRIGSSLSRVGLGRVTFSTGTGTPAFTREFLCCHCQ